MKILVWSRPVWGITFSIIALTLFFMFWPVIGAQAAKPLRHLLGNERVASIETVWLGWHDEWTQQKVSWGVVEPSAPWAAGIVTRPAPTATPWPTPTSLRPVLVTTAVVTPPPAGTPTPTATPSPTPTITPTPWALANLAPFGSLEGEGVWTPYLFNEGGQAVAYRTFLQPDPNRPLTIVGVVAFDLRQTNLNFVLGTEEPAAGAKSKGKIPAQDMQNGQLIAAFNGGFMASHGKYGAMAAGVEALPPADDLATLAMYMDGRVELGAWNELPAGEFTAWRQNAYMVVKDGQLTDETKHNSLFYWSGSIDNKVVTWRSGAGLSADKQVLYYVAGSGLDMVNLGTAMQRANIWQGMLLDINPFWVHFSAITSDAEGTLLASPLFPDDMTNHTDRFLRANTRDFFYVTLK